MLRNFALFYHLWTPPNSDLWRLLVDEQLRHIRRVGLDKAADVFCRISGDQAAAARKFVEIHDWVRIIDGLENGPFEGFTLGRLYQYCRTNPALEGVGYLHTKGASRFSSENVSPNEFQALNGWRHLLEWATLDRWNEAVALLPKFDVIGVDFKSAPWPHLAGNFWWSKPSYINKLCAPEEMRLPDEFHPRYCFEAWVASNSPKVHCFFNTASAAPNVNLYREDIEPYFRAALARE